MPVATVDAFLETLEQSAILSVAEAARAKRIAEGSNEPKDVARGLVQQGMLSKWQAAVILAGSNALRVGDYVLLERLETLDTGQVYLVRNHKTQQQGVLATLSRELKADSQHAQKLVAELQERFQSHEPQSEAAVVQAQEEDRRFVVAHPLDGPHMQDVALWMKHWLTSSFDDEEQDGRTELHSVQEPPTQLHPTEAATPAPTRKQTPGLVAGVVGFIFALIVLGATSFGVVRWLVSSSSSSQPPAPHNEPALASNVAPEQTDHAPTSDPDRGYEPANNQGSAVGNDADSSSGELADHSRENSSAESEPTDPKPGDEPISDVVSQPESGDTLPIEAETLATSSSDQPFDKLPDAVDLPPLDSDSQDDGFTPSVLGQVLISEGDLFFLDLAGGDSAGRGKMTFALQSRQPAPIARRWDVELHKPDSSALTIAKLWIEDQQFKFQWNKRATQDGGANHLRNCVLSMRTDFAAASTALRTPIEFNALSLGADQENALQRTIHIPWLPDLTSVQVELLSLENGFPVYRFEPKTALQAAKGSAKIFFGNRTQQLYLRVDCRMTRNLYVNGGWFSQGRKGKAQRFNVRKIDQYLSETLAARQNLTRQEERLKKLRGNEKKRMQPMLEETQIRLEQARAMVMLLGDLRLRLGKKKNAGQLMFRVFYKAGDFPVTLAETRSNL